MKLLRTATVLAGVLRAAIFAAETPVHQVGYQQAYGESKTNVALNPATDLPRYAPVEPKDAVATWKVKAGFKLQLAAAEPLVRDPIAICFDENGRMFVCEMIDYSEMRDATPHLGRISVLEDTDGDGVYDKSTVFADDLPWPTGLIWANGGLYVAATPDIWRFEDRDGDGRAEVRTKVFTGFGTGLARLNVQAMLNSFQWGQDNRIHVQSGSGNRGKIQCLLRPDLPAVELAARDFWFDPRTHDFGFESGGAQYGMSFDNFGRKFACSNSDHLQFWIFDDKYAARNPFYHPQSARQSIAADGGAAEVFRISPDEPWRIVRTRWRISGVVKGPVEGGGRVSGYFTGATGTTVFRGDAYGQDFVNNTFTGDAGGQLVHRKKIYENGASLIGRRPDDEHGFEFAASTDTWVRVVNFANAPDGTLHICDMYREVIEHPWSLPEEIKKHLDLNSGNSRGRIYRVVPDNPTWKRRPNVALGHAATEELVATLEHPNGWHRDTASRLLYERHDATAVPLLAKLVRESRSAVARQHALGVLSGLSALDETTVLTALGDTDPRVRERAIGLSESLPSAAVFDSRLAALARDPDARVRMQLAFTLGNMLAKAGADTSPLTAAFARLAAQDWKDEWISAAVLSAPPEVVNTVVFPAFIKNPTAARAAATFVAKLIEIRGASRSADGFVTLIDFVAQPGTSASWLRALGEGLKRAGTSIPEADAGRKLAAVFATASTIAAEPTATEPERLRAIEILSVASFAQSREALIAATGPKQPEAVQAAAIVVLAGNAVPDVTAAFVRGWSNFAPIAKSAALAALTSRDDRVPALLTAIESGTIKASELSATQVQALTRHKNPTLAARARAALSTEIPATPEQLAAKFQSAVTTSGDVGRGLTQ
ncbi:MAG: PVC-type heme-binding CxxCH protein, partial [Opitutaceae bacterium]